MNRLCQSSFHKLVSFAYKKLIIDSFGSFWLLYRFTWLVILAILWQQFLGIKIILSQRFLDRNIVCMDLVVVLVSYFGYIVSTIPWYKHYLHGSTWFVNLAILSQRFLGWMDLAITFSTIHWFKHRLQCMDLLGKSFWL